MNTSRLDRFISKKLSIKRQAVRLLLAQRRVCVNGVIASDINQTVDNFSSIEFDGKPLQANTPHYIALNKPAGVVSATQDKQHTTVIDLLNYPFKNELHIVGRLDLNSTGLLLLTNDSRWSRKLMSPDNKISKQYRVKLENSLSEEYAEAFDEGMYFSYEDITTQPVKLKIINEFVAELTLIEGRYHQIKRMFGRFRNPVLELHRFAIGNLHLGKALEPGESRQLSSSEIEAIF